MYVDIRDVRCEAAEALGKRGDVRGIEALLTLCSDKNVTVRSDAIISLGLLADEREAPRFERYSNARPYSANKDLCNLDETLLRVLSTLISVCENKRERAYVRCQAIVALGNIGNAHPTVIAALDSLRFDSEKEVCHTATQIRGAFDGGDTAMLETLFQNLENGQGSSREDWIALWILSRALREQEVEAWIQEQEVTPFATGHPGDDLST